VVAERLARIFRLPKWRFVNSGTEAPIEAIRIARGYTGRDQVLKIFGSYHGHHDYVMVGLGVTDFGDIGPRNNCKSISYGAGIPASVVEMTATVPFNDAPAVEARIERLIEEGAEAGLPHHGGGHDEPAGAPDMVTLGKAWGRGCPLALSGLPRRSRRWWLPGRFIRWGPTTATPYPWLRLALISRRS